MDKPSSLVDATKKSHATRLAGFANSLIPKSVSSTEEPTSEPSAPVAQQPSPEPEPTVEVQKPVPAGAEPVTPKQEPDATPVSTPKPATASTPKSERRKVAGSSIVLEEILQQPANKSTEYKKYIAISKENHKLLRDLNYKYDVPMNVILNNVLEIVQRTVTKEEAKL
ncbi:MULTISPECIES: hypothetical protein [Larkinella]|jgi:hypothetical protein|uniref:DUF3408 domain-containing protein n=1 Tax=Larkinella punicea TaxID=2315727 RepID=A0A368JHC0_9BACT|nr:MULTISPECIES: hypothetical protein [Larkinella]RCR67068.1 hypothetical protein DUE52_23720 [Larkinella punicea]